MLTHEEADALGDSVTEWKGHMIESVSLRNAVHSDGTFVERF